MSKGYTELNQQQQQQLLEVDHEIEVQQTFWPKIKRNLPWTVLAAVVLSLILPYIPMRPRRNRRALVEEMDYPDAVLLIMILAIIGLL